MKLKNKVLTNIISMILILSLLLQIIGMDVLAGTVSALKVETVSGAPVSALILAGGTLMCGVLNTANGAADIQQSITGNNFIRDTVFQEQQNYYDAYAGRIEFLTTMGASSCIKYITSQCTMKGSVPDTERKVILQPGDTLDRYGSPYGRYLTDPGTPPSKLALPFENTGSLNRYIVNRPLSLKTGTVASHPLWGSGGGVQYFSWRSVYRLTQLGILTKI